MFPSEKDNEEYLLRDSSGFPVNYPTRVDHTDILCYLKQQTIL